MVAVSCGLKTTWTDETIGGPRSPPLHLSQMTGCERVRRSLHAAGGMRCIESFWTRMHRSYGVAGRAPAKQKKKQQWRRHEGRQRWNRHEDGTPSAWRRDMQSLVRPPGSTAQFATLCSLLLCSTWLLSGAPSACRGGDQHPVGENCGLCSHSTVAVMCLDSHLRAMGWRLQCADRRHHSGNDQSLCAADQTSLVQRDRCG